MSFRKYAKYKESGVEWLGEVPKHWEMRRLKFCVQLTDQKIEADREKPLPYVGLENIQSWTGKLLTIDPNVVPTSIANHFGKGMTLFGKLRPYLAKACNPDFEGLCSTELLVFKSTGFDRRLLLYLLLTDGFIKVVDSSTYGAKMPRANWDFIGNCIVPVPPLEEQKRIAAFLDRETTKIDTLIDKHEQLITLLQEKRQAIISHAVTRGLNSNVKMKDSGIEWLGEVPVEWQVKKLKFVARVQPSNVDKKSKKNEKEVLLCNYTDVYYNGKITENLPLMKSTASDVQIRKFTLKRGDTIITKDSEDPNDIAVPAYVPQDLEGVICGYHLALLRPGKGTCGEYLKRVMDSRYARSVFATRANGITRYGLATYAISNFIIPLPPLEEQKQIAVFLDKETTKIDTLIEQCKTAIELLRERRTALISAAVTGKMMCGVLSKGG